MTDTPTSIVPIKAPETAPATVLPGQGTSTSNPPRVAVAVTPTQVRRPWRSTARTIFQVVVAVATLVPFVVAGAYGDATDPADYAPAVVQVLGVSAAITRVMALPQVETFLRTFLPFLAAAPKA